MTQNGEEDRTRTLWKYFFPLEKHTVHIVCAKAGYRNYSTPPLRLYLTAFNGHPSNGVLISIRTAKWGQKVVHFSLSASVSRPKHGSHAARMICRVEGENVGDHQQVIKSTKRMYVW